MNTVSDLSNQLHRFLGNDGRCWLILDPGAMGFVDTSPLKQCLKDRQWYAVPSPHPQLDSALLPVLILLNSATLKDSQALSEVLDIARQELSPAHLNTGAGRQVCAWLQLPAELDDEQQARLLTQHLSRNLVANHQQQTLLLRWYDPAVWWCLWPLLTELQRSVLLGPIHKAWLLDPLGNAVGIEPASASTHPSAADGPLILTDNQWQQLEHITAFNAALRSAMPTTAPQLAQARSHIMSALERAREHHIHDAQDLARYAELVLQVHPQFDAHPLITQRLRPKAPQDYFTAAIADLDDAQWQQIKTDCSRGQLAAVANS